jgi:hypothetical protein
MVSKGGNAAWLFEQQRWSVVVVIGILACVVENEMPSCWCNSGGFSVGGSGLVNLFTSLIFCDGHFIYNQFFFSLDWNAIIANVGSRWSVVEQASLCFEISMNVKFLEVFVYGIWLVEA